MANNYLGQTDEYKEPSKLQQVMKAISERMLRAAAGGGDTAAYNMLPEQQAMREREMGLKERGFNMEQENMRFNNDLKRQALSQKDPSINLTPAQKAADIAFGKDYADYNLKGGFSGVQRQLAQLSEVADALEKGDIMTGPIQGATVASGALGSVFNPSLMAAQQAVQQSVQQTLRQTLGAQFTEKEGKMMMDRAFDPKLPTQENIKKIRNTMNELKAMIDAKENAGQYYQQYGTLKGFSGTSNRSKEDMNTASNNPNDSIGNALSRIIEPKAAYANDNNVDYNNLSDEELYKLWKQKKGIK